MFGRNKGQRNMSPSPIVPSAASYSQRAADSLSVYNADLEPPATSYASTKSGLSSRYTTPTIGPKVNAAYVDRKPRMNGLKFNWSWGGINMGKLIGSLPGVTGGLNGFIRSSSFQPTLVQLHDWQTNDNWYIAWNGTGAGMFQHQKAERYTYPSFRVAQIHTQTSGGVGPGRMTKMPQYRSVQAIKKYTAQPSYYNTKGTKS